jgi:hypothetical protein
MMGVTPPFVLGFLAHQPQSTIFSDFSSGNQIMPYIIFGLVMNLVLSLIFFLFAYQRFYRNSGRVHNLKE